MRKSYNHTQSNKTSVLGALLKAKVCERFMLKKQNFIPNHEFFLKNPINSD
jgi:hypothetical protein